MLAEKIGIEGGLGVFCLNPFVLGCAVSPLLLEAIFEDKGGELLLDNLPETLPIVGMFWPEVADLSVDDLAYRKTTKYISRLSV